MQGEPILTESDKWWLVAFAACFAVILAEQTTDDYNVKVGDDLILYRTERCHLQPALA